MSTWSPAAATRDALLRAGLAEGVDFTAIDTESMVLPLERVVRAIAGPNKGWAMVTGMSLPSYWMLEHILWRRFAADLRGGRFDLVHRITPLAAPIPSLLAPALPADRGAVRARAAQWRTALAAGLPEPAAAGGRISVEATRGVPAGAGLSRHQAMRQRDHGGRGQRAGRPAAALARQGGLRARERHRAIPLPEAGRPHPPTPIPGGRCGPCSWPAGSLQGRGHADRGRARRCWPPGGSPCRSSASGRNARRSTPRWRRWA